MTNVGRYSNFCRKRQEYVHERQFATKNKKRALSTDNAPAVFLIF